ncbi:unnamed protein product [Meganyctiphanes norvegica]|uniref:Uncharacterized protein n=1 Tax=Meganyctiphanes norvegica TaxID=48144 RepID=A0AAV2PKR4_MEGNR
MEKEKRRKGGRCMVQLNNANINSLRFGQLSGHLQNISIIRTWRTWDICRSLLLFGYNGSIWLFFSLLNCLGSFQKIKSKLNSLWENHGHRITSSFSFIMYCLDTCTDIYTVYKTDNPRHIFMRYIGITIISTSCLTSSTVNYYYMHKRWSTAQSTKRWYHYFIYTGVGFLLLPFCLLAENAKKAWSLERKQFEDEVPADIKYVIITESLLEGGSQFCLQVGFIILVSGEDHNFTENIKWYRWVSIFLSLLSTARGASFLLEMRNIAPHTTSALKIVYLMVTIGKLFIVSWK